MAENAVPASAPGTVWLGLPLRVLRFPFDLLFLTWDFLRLTAWGVRSLPARLSGVKPRPFGPRFEGGILEETPNGAVWYCPLAARYGTKSLLHLLFCRLGWHTEPSGRRVMCWDGSSSLPPTEWGRYLLAAIVLATLWGVPGALLAWRYRHHIYDLVPLRHRPIQAEAPPPSLHNPEMAAQFVAQAAALESAGKIEEARTRYGEAASRDQRLIAAQLGLGRTCLELGMQDQARQAFARALELDATDREAMAGLARVMHAQGADRKAVELLQTLTQRYPDNAEAHALQATCLVALNEMDAAAAAIEKALALAPADQTALATAADLELRRGNLNKAESYYRALIDQNARNPQGRIGVARILRIKGNVREAEALLRALLAEQPEQMQAIDELVDVLLASERPLDGLALCRDTIAKHPGNIRLREKQMGILAGLGRDNDLYLAATKLIADSPGNAAAHLQLGAMFLRKGLPALTIDHCSKALAQQPGHEVAYRLLTGALLAVGDVEQAKERLDRLLAVLPQDLDALVKLSECYRRKGDADKALAVLRQAAESHPGSALARSQLAQALFVASDPAGALAEFREAYRLTPDDPKALNNLAAVINYANGDLNEALALAERARTLEPRNPQILDTLAWVHFRRGAAATALPFSETAVALQPEMPILRYHNGAILAALGRPAEAKASLKAALAGGADFHGSAEARALLQELPADAATKPN